MKEYTLEVGCDGLGCGNNTSVTQEDPGDAFTFLRSFGWRLGLALDDADLCPVCAVGEVSAQ